MSEKIDLAKIINDIGWHDISPDTMRALVRAVRAARAFADNGWHVADRMALDAALAPFTDSSDSAEVK